VYQRIQTQLQPYGNSVERRYQLLRHVSVLDASGLGWRIKGSRDWEHVVVEAVANNWSRRPGANGKRAVSATRPGARATTAQAVVAMPGVALYGGAGGALAEVRSAEFQEGVSDKVIHVERQIDTGVGELFGAWAEQDEWIVRGTSQNAKDATALRNYFTVA